MGGGGGSGGGQGCTLSENWLVSFQPQIGKELSSQPALISVLAAVGALSPNNSGTSPDSTASRLGV